MTEPKDPLNESTRRNLEETLHRADQAAKNKSRVLRIVKAASEKAAQKRRSFNQILRDLELMFCLLRAWASGRYTVAPWKSVVSILAAVIYFLNPFDVLPDMLPGVGFIDDAFVIGFVFESFKTDLKRFLEWEKNSSSPASAAPEEPPSGQGRAP